MVGRSRYRPGPLGAFVFLFLISSPASSQPTPEARAAAIRKLIDRNRQYSLHCLCWAYTDETRVAVRKKVTPSDVPALILLLKDPMGPVTFAARDLLVDFAGVSEPLLKAAHMSRDDQLSVAAFDVLLEIGRKRGGDAEKMIQEGSNARARVVDEALPRPSPAVVALIEKSVETTSPECRRRTIYDTFWMDWECGASTVRIGVTEFASAEAASRRLKRATQGRGPIVPLAGVGQESGVADWKEQRAKEWRGGAFLAFRRDTFVVTAETTIMSGGMGAEEPALVQARIRGIAKGVDTGLVQNPPKPLIH